MGKIRVKTLGDETLEREQQKEARARRDAKKIAKEKSHVKGVGLKGGQQIKVMEGVELAPEVEAAVAEAEGKEVKKKSKKIKVHKYSRRYKDLRTLVDRTKSYSIKEALKLLKKTSNTKFVGTVEAHININAATLPKDKPSLSGSVTLPHGTGKKRVIAIADEALIAKVTEGKIEFDILVAHPSMMPKLAKVARILGPKGLMPNPKNGTVTTDPQKRVTELSGGEVSWKTEPDHPVIHQILGKVNFSDEQLSENIKSLIKSIGMGKIAKISLNATMGPGIRVDLNTVQ